MIDDIELLKYMVTQPVYILFNILLPFYTLKLKRKWIGPMHLSILSQLDPPAPEFP
jgi:hypothetical protein